MEIQLELVEAYYQTRKTLCNGNRSFQENRVKVPESDRSSIAR
jgi:hypothetical protein